MTQRNDAAVSIYDTTPIFFVKSLIFSCKNSLNSGDSSTSTSSNSPNTNRPTP